MIIQKAIQDIVESDLNALIAAQVREGKHIEYKEKVDLGTDDKKRKFLASIASFANASGGDILVGIKADAGLPTQIVPLQGFDPDKNIRTLRDIIRAHIDPPIFGIEFKEIVLKTDYALVIRIPRTWAGAHMVTYNDDRRFYTRDQNGRVLMNVPEIRNAFTLAEALAQRIQRFRGERLTAIRSGETAVNLAVGPKYVFHAFPFRSFEAGFCCNLNAVLQDHAFGPLNSAYGYSRTHDVEGAYAYEIIKDHPSFGYSLALRTGALELVENLLGGSLENRLISNPGFEQELFRAYRLCLKWLRAIEVDPPFLFSLSMLDIKDFTLFFHHPPIPLRRIRHSDLLIPDVLVESFEASPDTVLRPICDAIWQACGLMHSFNFDDQGKFKSTN